MQPYLLLSIAALTAAFYTPHSGPWNNFNSANGGPPVGALGNPWAEAYPGPLGAWANGYGSPFGFNPWMTAAIGGNNGGSSDSEGESGSDYWSVPSVAGWIVPNNPDALTPWGVNIADAIPVMTAPERRRM